MKKSTLMPVGAREITWSDLVAAAVAPAAVVGVVVVVVAAQLMKGMGEVEAEREWGRGAAEAGDIAACRRWSRPQKRLEWNSRRRAPDQAGPICPRLVEKGWEAGRRRRGGRGGQGKGRR